MDRFTKIFHHPVNVIAYHMDAHSDELIAGCILKEFGEPVFPGISKARVRFLEAMPAGKTWRDLFFKERMLVVGMGFSPYDEHLSNGTRIPNACAATLVADSLDLREDIALKGLLDFTLSRDCGMGGSVFELPALIKTMWRAGRNKTEIVDIASKIFHDIYAEGMQFVEEAGRDARNAKISPVVIAGGRVVKFAAGYSDSSKFGSYMRSPYGGSCGIVLRKSFSGQINIQTNVKMEIDLTPVIQMLRYLELRATGKPIPSLRVLAQPGTIKECPELYFFEKGRMIMSARGEGPLHLSMSEMKAAICSALGSNPKIQETDHHFMADASALQCVSA